ncbi:hypothetical protein Tco_1151732, partial [Tanacetum coccineum]
MGDASMLKPTLMAFVPAILDRVRDGVVEKRGGLAKKLFNIAFQTRLLAVDRSWLGAWEVEKLLWDAIVFKKIHYVLGGDIRFMLCGGAPLALDTQKFINVYAGNGMSYKSTFYHIHMQWLFKMYVAGFLPFETKVAPSQCAGDMPPRIPKFVLISVHDYYVPSFLHTDGYFTGEKRLTPRSSPSTRLL